MKLRYRLCTIILLFGFLTFEAAPSFAQVDDIGRILQAGREDANTLARAYLEPFGTGFGASLNTGWTNTAKTHGKFGFDITVSSGLAIVPDADKTFDVTELDLQKLELESGSPVSPTINGDEEPGALLASYEEINGSREKILEFNMPEGSGFGYVPAPVIKAGVGLVKDTELMVRYTPETEVSDFGNFNLFGMGAKHGINQWLPGGNMLPVDLSVMVGYTNMEVGSDLTLTAEDVIQGQDNYIENPHSSAKWENQTVALDTDAWTFNALVGKSLPIVSVYAGLGYETSTVNIATPGSYPTIAQKSDYPNSAPNNEPQKPLFIKSVDDPIDISIDGDNNLRALAGFRLKLAVLHVSGSYTLSNYSSFNLGVGISFR